MTDDSSDKDEAARDRARLRHGLETDPAKTIQRLEEEVATLRKELARQMSINSIRWVGSASLASSTTHLQAVLANAPIILFAFDSMGVMTLQEGWLLNALGLRPGQRIGENVFETFGNLGGAQAAVGQALSGVMTSWEGEVGPLHLQIRLVPELDADGRVTQVVGIAVDVTEQKRVASALVASEARQRIIMERLPDLVVALVDKTGRVSYVTPSAERVVGVSREALLGTGTLDFIAENRRGEVGAALGQLMANPGGTYSLETELVRPDGGTRWIEVNAYNGLLVPHFESLIIVYRDISERRRADDLLAETHTQLRQAQKLEAIGSLAGGIAHDFNNLLTIIMSCTSLVLSDLEPDDPNRDDLEEVAGAASRAAELTRQLLSFSRQQVLSPLVVDPRETIVGLERMLTRLLGEHIRLSLQLDPHATRVFVDPSQLEQIIINLTVNSRDAMPDGGVLVIECSAVHLDEEYAQTHHEVTPGRYVMIAVSDTGVGMTREVMARIFDPFFTTKDVGRGTGLGLSTVFGIVKQSGGHIWPYSEVGVGTTFRIYLPETSRKAPSVTAVRPSPDSLHGTETILLVEDDGGVRQTLRSILVRHGYVVLEAANGGEAILICEQHAGRIDLLVSDMIMPRMSGRQLATRLRVDRPALKVLFVSGYTEGAVSAQNLLDGTSHYLAKPVTPTSLALKVRAVLDQVG